MKFIFLDRDGTINEEVNYLHKTEDLRFIAGVPQALARLRKAGFLLVVVTNQAGIARGYYTEADCAALNHYMNEQLAAYGAHIDAFYACPHHPQKGIGTYKVACQCRKPKTGMFMQAARDAQAGRFFWQKDAGDARVWAETKLVDADLQGLAPEGADKPAAGELRCIDRAHSFMLGDKLIDTQAGHAFGLRSILLGSGYGKTERKTAKPGDFDRYFETMEEAVTWILEQSEN